MVFNETTNYDLILPSKSYQRHSETRTANVWDLVHNQPFNKTLLVFADLLTRKTHQAQSTNRTSRLCWQDYRTAY